MEGEDGRVVEGIRQVNSPVAGRRGGCAHLGIDSWRAFSAAASLRRGGCDPRSAATRAMLAKLYEQPARPKQHGEVAEWTKAPVLGTGPARGTEGSNPSFTAERESHRALPHLNSDRVVPRRWVGQRMAERPTSPAPRPRCAAADRWSGALCREAEAPDA
jgi:hypothetical protein